MSDQPEPWDALLDDVVTSATVYDHDRPSDPLADIQQAYAKINALRRQVVCHPSDEERLRSEIESEFPWVQLSTSELLEPGQAFIFAANG